MTVPVNATQRSAPVGTDEEVYLIFGAKGWIAGLLKEHLQSEGKTVHTTTVRIEDRRKVLDVLDHYKPTLAFNCAGVTGRPNVDWCEDNKQATVRANVVGTITLADCCSQRDVHLTNFATGCIYQYDEKHQWHGVGFTEEDKPNFEGSYYSYTKAMTEALLKSFPNVLTLRLRMPVSDDLSPRNFVTKITKYERVVDIPNSNTILHDLLPASVAMAGRRLTGVYNFTNPGAISHNEVLTLYKKYIDPEFTWKNFSLEEQAKVIKAGRSNCELDTTKLTNALAELGIQIPEIHEAYAQCFQRMARNLKSGKDKPSEDSLNAFADKIFHDVGVAASEPKKEIRNILITGGAGFIASYAVRKFVLLYPEYNIINIDKIDYCSSTRNFHGLEGKANYTFIKGDITSADLMRFVFEEKNIDTIIHFAAQTHVDNSFGNSAEFTVSNVMGTHVLLEVARAHKIHRFIHISTDEVYGEVADGGKDLAEESVLAPTNPYAATKAAAEMMVAAYYNSFNLPIIVTRSNNVYGPYQFPEKIIPKFINRLNRGEKCCLHGDGTNTRRYIYGTDVADAVDVILHKGKVGETYNIGTQYEISNRELASQLIKHTGVGKSGDSSDYIEFVADRPFNDRRYAVDSTKLEALGWKVKVPFHEGLAKTVKWYTLYGRDWWGDVSYALKPHPLRGSPSHPALSSTKF